MERDFMGLGVVQIKQEIQMPQEITDSATWKNSSLLWSVSKKLDESVPETISFDLLKDKNHKLTSPFQAKNGRNGVVDITQIRNNYVATRPPVPAPAQMTMFYGGSVCVFDKVSFEKAQAIMLLAGNGPLSSPSSILQSHVQTPTVQPYIADSSVAKPSHYMNFSSSSQISPASISNTRSVGGYLDDVATTWNIGALRSPLSKEEPQKTVNSIGSFTANTISSRSVPQFRKASLTRFLEKRKERVMNASPYSSEMNLSGSLPLPATS